jgi:4-amino-4-deoxy-L-arabinose transferase-like glycosyltransferase
VTGIVADAKQAMIWPRAIWAERRDQICLGLLIASWVLSTAVWAWQDTAPPMYDDSSYLSVSLRQLAVLQGPRQQVGELMDISYGGRPPLYTLVVQPLYMLVGTPEDVAMVATNSLFIVILVLSVYAIGRHLFDSPTGLLAALLLAGYPALGVISRRYLPYFAAVAMTTLGAYLVLRTEDFRNSRYAIGFGVVTGLGLLTSVWVSIGLLGFGIWFGLRSLYRACRLREPEEQRAALLRTLSNGILALAIVLAVALPWYLHNGKWLLSILRSTQMSKRYAPVEDLLSLRALLWYLLNMHRALSVFLVPPFVLGVIAALVRPKGSSTTMLCWFGACCLPLSLLASKTPTFFMLIAPAVALLSAFWVFQVRPTQLRGLLLGFLVLTSACVFLQVGWEPLRTNAILPSLGVSAAPPVDENWHIGDVVDLVADDRPGESATLLVVGNIPRFHEWAFQYEALRRDYRGSIWGCRSAEPESLLDAQYVVVLLRGMGRPMAQLWGITPCQTWSDLLRSPPEAFLANHDLLGTFALPEQSEARVFKVTHQPSAAERAALSEAIPRLAFLDYDLQPTDTTPGGILNVSLSWQALSKMDRDYTAFIHVVGSDDRIWAQQDRLLEHRADPTSMWLEGTTVTESYELELADDTPPGDYTVKIGVYYWETAKRLPIWNENTRSVADDTIVLQPVTVQD